MYSPVSLQSQDTAQHPAQPQPVVLARALPSLLPTIPTSFPQPKPVLISSPMSMSCAIAVQSAVQPPDDLSQAELAQWDMSDAVYTYPARVRDVDQDARIGALFAASRADGRPRILLRFVPHIWCRWKGKWRYMPLSGACVRASVHGEAAARALLLLHGTVLLGINGQVLADSSADVARTQARDASFDTAL